MRPVRARQVPPHFTFGGRVPPAIGLVIAVTVALSLAVAFGDRHAGSLYDLVVLMPSSVWRGQIWRLATWAFIEPSPFGLIFQCLFVVWFGRDLVDVWGGRRFLVVYGGLVIGIGIAMCLAAQLDSALLHHATMGGWPLAGALTVAWGLTFPDRVVRIYFILPIRGRVLAWLTIAFTGVFAIYQGWEGLAPELIAEISMLAWMYRRKLSLRRQGARVTSELRRGSARRPASGVRHLRVVESPPDRDLPN